MIFLPRATMLRRILSLSVSIFLAGGMLLGTTACQTVKKDPAPHYVMTQDDEALLEEISSAAFEYFIDYAHPETGLVADKISMADICSVAAQGFGFAVVPVAVERGWITHEEGEEKVLQALRTLHNSNGRRFGLYAHFLDMNTGHASMDAYEVGISTIDSALMIAGALVAGEYFGGEVRDIANEIYAEMNWSAFQNPNRGGQIHMLWEPEDKNNFEGPGRFTPPVWDWYSDETLLIVILGTSAPNEEYRLPQSAWSNWNRPVGNDGNREFVYTWPGTLFTYTFANLFLDFSTLGEDPNGINWWDNTRKAVLSNRDWCRAHAREWKTFGRDRWGITAAGGPAYTYVVPGHQPRGAEGNDPGNGVLAPYGVGMSVPWEPRDTIAALRHMRHLVVGDTPLWQDVEGGGYGLWDSFSMDQEWVGKDIFAIANGPMIMGIENYRSGLIWNLIVKNEHLRDGLTRSGFQVP
ncbi:MAG: hypothetical protein JJU11_09290 [Candidatus Sumerlaeia bacterium]|nr:hypothetical protein [Candidatus Sumerlaeia bacterium]